MRRLVYGELDSRRRQVFLEFSFQGQEYRGVGIPVPDLRNSLNPTGCPGRPILQPISFSPTPTRNLFQTATAVCETKALKKRIYSNRRIPNPVGSQYLTSHHDTLRIVPGNYNLRIESKCGTKDYSLQVKEGESRIVEYLCGPAASNAPPHRADGVFEVQNQTGSPLSVK